MAVDLFDRVVGAHRLRVVATQRTDGDMHPERVSPGVLRERQLAVNASPWIMVDQVHGRDAHVVSAADNWPLAAVADVVVSNPPSRQPIAVWAADCTPIVLFGRSGLVVAAHAGWRGLARGVLDVAVDAISDAGDDIVATVVGPVIHPCCYAFSSDDTALVAAGVHCEPEAITGSTAAGLPALDVPAAVRSALAWRGIVADVVGDCTGCTDRWFSHRARAEPGRHAVVAWVAAPDRVTT